MDEREKLRKFRELDDAFADALLALEKETSQSANEKQASDDALRESDFEQRLADLMQDYQQPAADVSELLTTMIALDKLT
ncbi:hypothetical protein [Halomonas halocynthiae]|uniref:hypothetical protein n=1 Tax=Halomonas halocynthiae TaxID=176290 RepID=UPI000406CA6B|nr:hypothetical protein [Halomonas halocynthiae]